MRDTQTRTLADLLAYHAARLAAASDAALAGDREYAAIEYCPENAEAIDRILTTANRARRAADRSRTAVRSITRRMRP